ncbi:TPA: hypothetical protein R1673_000470, partial [Campylobacter jejuni]
MYTPQARINTTVSGPQSNAIEEAIGSGSHSITIEKDGTLGNAGNGGTIINVHASNNDTPTVNLTNKGTINGEVYVTSKSGFKGTITVNTFENTGQVNGGVHIGNIKSTATNVNNFTNRGTIQSDGIVVNMMNAKINTFTNYGLIHGLNNGVAILSNNTIENFNNIGTIQSAEEAIYIMNYSNTIKNFNNSGLIQSTEKSGILLDGATIENFTNTGTIGTTGSGNRGAIYVMANGYGPSTINNFTNNGTITSKSNGILAEAGSKIETLVNKGSIEADLNGISFVNNGTFKHNKAEIGSIILENGSSIQAGNNGINIDHGNWKPIEIGGIEVKQDAVVNGGNAGIYIGDGKEINTQITISGEVSGGAAGIVNEGIINSDDKEGGIIISGGSVSSSNGGSGIVNQGNGSINGEIKVENGGSVEGGITNTGSGSISGNIVVENGGKLDSITNTSTSDTGISGSITNNSDNKLEISNGESATIGGGITNNGGGTITIDNQGTINKGDNGNHVTNNGNGSIIIEDWVVSTDK